MKKELYMVRFASAKYWGSEDACLVWAHNEDEARCIVTPYTEEVMYEDYEYYDDTEVGYEDVGGYPSITSITVLDESAYKKYIENASQSIFCPIVNSK